MTAKEFVTRLFDRWEHGDGQSFFNALAEDVRWTAIGNTPISGTCTSSFTSDIQTCQEDWKGVIS